MKSTRNFAIVFAISAPFLLVSKTVYAHAKLLKSSPSANEIVTASPSEVALHFSEELELTMSKLEIKNAKTGEVVSTGPLSEADNDKSSLKVSLKPLKKEKADYDVSWKAVAKDAHKMPGHLKFTYAPKK